MQTDEFRQGDEPWADQQLGTNSPHYLIRQTGCALTSVANMINFYANISTSIARTNPEQLNEVMISSNIYNNDDDVLWDMVPVLTEGVTFPHLLDQC